jgi:hypothetical protein
MPTQKWVSLSSVASDDWLFDAPPYRAVILDFRPATGYIAVVVTSDPDKIRTKSFSADQLDRAKAWVESEIAGFQKPSAPATPSGGGVG